MTITSIIRVPEVGEVGVKASFLTSGAPVGNEVRCYLAYAPVSSKLPTLATVSDDKRADARLKVDEAGAACFTPDVPGHYQVEAHDVTVTRTPRKYSDAPAVPDTDDDFAGAPVVDLSSGGGTARYNFGYLAVFETQSRLIGVGADTLTLAIKIHDIIETKAADPVVLTPSGSPLSKIAAYADPILGIRDLLLDGWVAGNRSNAVSFATGRLQQARSGLSVLQSGWALHLSASASWDVHDVADTADDVSVSAVTTLAQAITRLTTINAAYNAHRVSATYHTAPGAPDTTNIMPSYVVTPTDLPSAIEYARWLFVLLAWGFGGTTKEAVNPSAVILTGHFIGAAHQSPGDPLGNYTFDFSSTFTGLLLATAELTRIWNLHVGRTTMAAMHASADTNNTFSTPLSDDMGATELAQWANDWADSIERHTADSYKDATGAVVPFAVAKHQNTHPLKIGLRASNLGSAMAVIELCCVAEETHALDGGTGSAAHASQGYGFRNRSGPRPVMTRLQGHWKRATAVGIPTLPEHFNTEPLGLLGLGWK